MTAAAAFLISKGGSNGFMKKTISIFLTLKSTYKKITIKNTYFIIFFRKMLSFFEYIQYIDFDDFDQ